MKTRQVNVERGLQSGKENRIWQNKERPRQNDKSPGLQVPSGKKNRIWQKENAPELKARKFKGWKEKFTGMGRIDRIIR